MPLPQQFNPYIPQQELNKALEQYKQNPRSFTPQDINTLKDHARYYNIPFAEDEEKHQNTLGGLLSQAGQGFLEGFTTFDMFKDPPKDEWESISRNIGHLAGFVGFIPSAPFKLLGMKTLAQGAKKARGMSIPMIAAKKAQEAAGKLVAPALKNAVNARAGAVNTAAKFINDSPVIQDLITGGFHLGVASAASTWTKGVDEMMASFIGGAQTGAAFRFIGNMVKTDSELANKVIRGLSASLYQGMHATMAGATTPEQVYEYLLGAYFGVKEMPYHRRKAGKHLNEMAKKNETDPEVVKGWEDLDKKTQDYAKEVANKTYGVTEENLALGYRVAKEAGINVEQQQEYAENYAKELSKLQRLPSDVTSLETSTEKEKTQREVIKELETESSTIEAQRDLDVGSSLVDLPQSSYQIKNFTLKTLRESIESAKNPEKRLADYSFDIENKWESLLSESRQKSILDGSPPENPADSMVNYFKTKYNKELNQTDSSYWRSLGNRKLKQVKVPMLTWENGRIKEIEDVDIAPGVFPSNRAGNKKLLLEEPKVLDKVYQDLTGDPNASAYSVLDHAVVRTRKGYEEITLNQLGERKIEEDMSSFHVNNIVDMHAKGQYYFGGRGDAARHYYVKYHPSVEATNAGLNKQINEIFKNSPIKSKDYKEAYEDFISKNPIEDKNLAAEVFKKSFISNIYYDINVNGLSVSPKSIKTMFDDGFINNAKAFNKRAQIWFTSGLSSNKNFINSSLLNSKVPLADNQQYRVKLVEDSKEVLHTDGAIIGHPDVIKAMNLDYGLPTEGNTVKSFIVSPNKEYGALLGKYMIHRASDPVKEYMEKTGVHMIIPRSSAKQFGLRGSKLKGKRVLGEITTDKFGNVYLKGNNKQTKDYFVDPSHLKGIFSEKNDKHAMDDVSLPKQMQSNLTPYTYSASLLQGKEREAHVQKNAEVIEDMYNTLSSKSFEGDPAINSKVRMLMANPYKNEYLLKEINENFESIGIKHLIDGIKAPGNEKFANLAYNKMQRANEEFVKSLVEDGEMTLSEAETFRAEVGEQLKVHDKLMQLSNDSLAGIFHKFSRDYRVNSTRNYIITRLTKPKVGNSFTIKMRPYDEGLKIRKDEIGPTIKLGKKEGERLFFLDDGFKEYKIKSESFKDLLGKEESTLGEVWDLYRKKKFGANQEKVKEVLRTTLTRVPMDSMSGAHVLEFGGFTGIKGYGGLLHPKTMDALGGADLDGDKAFGFFGSEKYGFKKDWKDLYHKQKNENKGDTADSLKDEYRSLFTIEQETDAFTNPKQQYFPNTRFDISKAAYEGRMSLGPTVVNRATLNAAWSTIMGSKKKSYEYEGELVDDSMVRIKPLTDDANMQLFRKKARAAISFASDPMDEGGLRSKEVFWDSLAKHLFKWEVFDSKTNKPLKHMTEKYNDFEDIQFNRYRRQGLVKLMSDINSKLYGRDNIEGKRWTFYEINDTMRMIDTIEAGGRNTLLTKLADTMKDINYSDGVLSRVDFKKLLEMYDKHEGNVNNLRWLRDLLGRSTLRVNQGNLIDFIRKYRLHTPEGMREATEVGSKKWVKIEEELLKTKRVTEELITPSKPVRTIPVDDPAKPLTSSLPVKGDTPTMFYTGIGSRNTPPQVLSEITSIAKELEKAGYTLRTGNAAGADAQFRGAAKKKEVYYPKDANDTARDIAKEIHPMGKRLTPEKGLNLHARNTFQVFGKKLNKPSDFIITWTPDAAESYKQRGRDTGGTGQAIELASRRGIPVINLANPNWRTNLNIMLYGQKTPPKNNIIFPDGLSYEAALKKHVLYSSKEKIRGKGGIAKDVVPAFYSRKEGKIILNKEALDKKFKEKAWLKPKVKHVEPINEEFTKKEWEIFVLGHELGHMKDSPNKYERGTRKYGDVENRMNQKGLEAVNRYRQQKKEVFFYDAMNQLMNPERTLSNPKRRKYLLDKLVKQGEDFIVNDISDIASIEMLSKYGKEVKNSPLIQDIIKEVEYIKRMNYLMARKASVSRDISQIQALSPGEKKVLLEAEQILGKSQVDISELKSQAEIDARIIKFKEDKALTPEEKLFMDSLLLGSINRGYKDVISKLDSAVKAEQNKGNYVPSRFFEYEYNNLKKNADNTTVARIGFISSAVNEGVLKDYMKSYSELWDKSTGITPKVKTRVMQEVELSDKDRPILDAKGNRIEATTLETPERDRLNNQYLDEAKPFEGLHNGTLKGEAKDIYYSIKGHLNHYNNKVGKELNGVVREIVGKDLNSMNLEDWRTVDRYFKEIRNGTWYQRLFDKIKTDYPEIKKRYYHMFPEAINRDMLRYDMELMKVRRPYLDKQGKERIGEALKPTGVIDILQNYVHGAQENATRVSENQRKLLKEKLKPYIDSIPEGRGLYRMAVRIREYEGFKNENFDYKKYLIEESEKQGWDKLKDKKFGILIGDKRTPMTGREIVNKINDIITEQNKIVHKWLTGDKEKLERYLALDDGTHNGLVRLKNEFLKDLREASAKNEPLDIGLGIDGLNKISKKILMSQVPKIHRKRAQKELRKKFEVEDTDTNDLGVERYFPHVNFDRGQARKRLLESIEKVLDDKTLETRERETTVQRLIHHYKQMTGDWVSKDEMGDRWNELGTHLKNMADKKEASKDYIKWYKSQIKVGNQYSRSKEPIPGWDVDPEAYDFYMKNIVDSYYRATSQIASRTLINDWSGDFYSKSGNNARLTNAWRDFLNLYVQDSMGYPSQIPKSVLNNPDMKLKGTPYAWMADSNVLDRVNKIAAKLGIRQRKDLPGELKGFGHKDLSAWTNLEAKYQLASLLAHPKSSIANIYGGTAMTVVNTGWHNFRNARKIEYLRNTINSKWNRMQDVEDWVTSHGVIEEFLRYEADINPVVKGEKWNRFFDDAMAKIRKDPNMSDTTLRELGTKHKLTDRMFNAAASFMRVPERILRRDSFVAHYLQAKERFAGAITELNDPYLIEMAKKGVKSTQFLYSAPFRPAFSRSALGKVMTRFQLWSWNSVKFRNEVLREAKIRGFRTGTPEFEKFKRLAIADLFSLGLANVFMYSLFESALPAPWNWFQDTSDLMFGDDKERERAFFGAYPYPFQPLQMVTPPALRALPPLFKGIVTDDYSKLADYTIWSMFPFGRLAKDVVGPGGVIENPVYGVEKLTGIPYIQFVKQFKQKDKEE